jgi:hypothetical protein
MNDWLRKFLWGTKDTEVKVEHNGDAPTIESLLEKCQFGFQLRNDGKYCAVVQYNENVEKSCTTFVNYLSNLLDCRINTNWSICFLTMLTPDCNKFVKHTCLYSALNDAIERSQIQLDLKEQGYKESISEFSDTVYTRYYYTKYLSIDEFRELLINRVHEYFKEYEEEIKNKQKFKREGAVFVECK